MGKATFESGAQQLTESIENNSIITSSIDSPAASAFCIGIENATAVKIGHTGLSIYAYGESLFIGSVLDTVTAGPLNIGENTTGIIPKSDNTIILGSNNARWKYGYFVNLCSGWFDTIKGAQLKIDNDYSITPTSGLHHVDSTEKANINTINLIYMPQNANVELVLIADGGDITFGKKQGNIKSSGSIAKDTACKFIWDGLFWYSIGQ